MRQGHPYYKRALRLAPGNDDIRHNLSVAEARTKDNIEDIPEFLLRDVDARARRHDELYGVERPFAAAAGLCLALFLVYLLAPAAFVRKAGSTAPSSPLLLCMLTSVRAWANAARCSTTRGRR